MKKFFTNVELFGNPYGASRKKRALWANDSGIERYRGHEYLYFVGCAGSHHERAKDAALKLALAMKYLCLSVAILGEEKSCDGNEVYYMGGYGLFEVLREKT